MTSSAMTSSARRQRGVTLVELLIALTLVSMLSVGMLMAMRTSLTTLEKTTARLDDNRRSMAIQQTIERQISSTMPVMGDCGSPGGGAARVPIFRGNENALRLVTSYSLEDGARGYPRLVEFRITQDPRGGLRLIANEYLYFGPNSTLTHCSNQMDTAPEITPQTLVLAGRLATARFVYREFLIDSPLGGAWMPAWTRNNLPSVVRIEMTPLDQSPGHLPVLTLHVPIRVTRDVVAQYADQ